MYKLKPQKINFDNKLCSSFTGHIYPYQKTPDDHRYIVKHIMAHDIDELFLFLQEVILGFNCDHPSIHSVQGYHIEKIQPRGFNIYIKYNRNVESITQVIERCRNEKKFLTEEEIIKILYNISCGLEYLHNKNIAHKNIKPIDIMIDSEGKAQLGGIGTNEILEDNKANVLFAKSVVSCYKAPELQSSTQKLKRRDLFKADVWSLGVNIAELCVLKTDFVNFSLQSPKKIEADIQKKLKGLEGRYSKAFMELLSGMLRYDPAQRKHIKDIRIMLEEQFTSILGLDIIPDFMEYCKVNLENAEDPNQNQMLIEDEKTVSTQYEDKKLEEESPEHKNSLELLKQELEAKWKSLIKFDLEKDFGIEATNYSRLTDESLKKFLDDVVHKSIEKHLYDLGSFELNLYGCDKITDNGIHNLVLQIGNNFKNLTTLSLGLPGSDQITDCSVKNIATQIVSNLKFLKKLSLNFNFCRQISEQAIIELSKQIGCNFKDLEHLTLNLHFCEKMTDKALKEISSQIGQSMRGLQHLSLDFAGCRQIGDESVGELAEQLSYNLGTMRHLQLSFGHSDKITDQGVTELAIQIGQSLPDLQFFGLDIGGCNKITDQGVMELATHIGANLKNLQQFLFNLSGCKQITDVGVKEFGDQLSNNCQSLMLLCFNLIQTPISFSLRNYLKDVLGYIPSLNIHF